MSGFVKGVDWISPKKNRLPQTVARCRPSKNSKDFFDYHYGWTTRRFNWFRHAADTRLKVYMRFWICVPFALRVVSILGGRCILEPVVWAVVPNTIWNPAHIDYDSVSEDRWSGMLLRRLVHGAGHTAWTRA